MPDNVTIIDVGDLPNADNPTIEMYATITDRISSKTYKIPYSGIRNLLGIDALEGGTENAGLLTVPSSNVNTYNISGGPGTYSNFLVSAGTPAVFSSLELDSKEWQLRRLDGETYWTKHEVKLSADLSSFINKFTDIGTFSGKNLYRSSYVLLDKAVASNGTLGTVVGAKTVEMPVTALQFYVISGYAANSGKSLAFVDIANNPIELSPGVYRTTLFASTTVIQAPVGTVKMRFTPKLAADNDSTWALIQVEKGTAATAWEAPVDYINLINGAYLQAIQIGEGSRAPDTDSPMGVANIQTVKRIAIKESDFTVDFSPNLADPYYIIADKYVNNLGVITTGAGWHMILIPATGNPTKTFGGFTITSGGYGAYFDANKNPIGGSVFALSNGTMPKTTTQPVGAVWLGIDIGRPGDTNYSSLIINEGPSLIGYVSPLSTIKKILRYSVGGGTEINSFFDIQQVPVYNGNEGKAMKYSDSGATIEMFEQIEQGGDAHFSRVSASAIELNLQVWNGVPPVPSGLLVGDGYLTPDGTLKRRMV